MLVASHPEKHTTHYPTHHFCPHPNIHGDTSILQETNSWVLLSVVLLCSSMKLGKHVPISQLQPKSQDFWKLILGPSCDYNRDGKTQIWKKPAIRKRCVNFTHLWIFESYRHTPFFGGQKCVHVIHHIPVDVPCLGLIKIRQAKSLTSTMSLWPTLRTLR